MITRLFSCAVALALTVAVTIFVPARAEVYADDPKSNDPNRPTIEALAKEVAPLPTFFGCPEFAWGQMSPKQDSATLEFVPPGDDVRKWTRLFTVTTIALPSKEDDRLALMEKLQVVAFYKFDGRGKLLHAILKDAKGAAVTFIEYEIGVGDAKEHAALGVVRLRDDLAALVQIQSRGAPLPKEDATKMENYVLKGIKN